MINYSRKFPSSLHDTEACARISKCSATKSYANSIACYVDRILRAKNLPTADAALHRRRANRLE
jgi:hypothetical protein